MNVTELKRRGDCITQISIGQNVSLRSLRAQSLVWSEVDPHRRWAAGSSGHTLQEANWTRMRRNEGTANRWMRTVQICASRSFPAYGSPVPSRLPVLPSPLPPFLDPRSQPSPASWSSGLFFSFAFALSLLFLYLTLLHFSYLFHCSRRLALDLALVRITHSALMMMFASRRKSGHRGVWEEGMFNMLWWHLKRECVWERVFLVVVAPGSWLSSTTLSHPILFHQALPRLHHQRSLPHHHFSLFFSSVVFLRPEFWSTSPLQNRHTRVP